MKFNPQLLWDHDTPFREPGVVLVGIDEVGRGPLAGNVVAAAVVLDPQRPVLGIRDSKKLSADQRDRYFDRIVEQSIAYGVGEAGLAFKEGQERVLVFLKQSVYLQFPAE